MIPGRWLLGSLSCLTLIQLVCALFYGRRLPTKAIIFVFCFLMARRHVLTPNKKWTAWHRTYRIAEFLSCLDRFSIASHQHLRRLLFFRGRVTRGLTAGLVLLLALLWWLYILPSRILITTILCAFGVPGVRLGDDVEGRHYSRSLGRLLAGLRSSRQTGTTTVVERFFPCQNIPAYLK